MYKAKIFIFILFIGLNDAGASVSDHMKDFFEGGSSNFSEPSYVKGQKGGYMSLGGYTSRYRVSNTQLTSMQLPAYRVGCGGIDFYAGGLSFINADQISKLIKNIGQSSTGLMVQLGVEMLSPKMSSLIKYFNDMQQKVNALNINSCNAARSLIAGGIGFASKEAGCKASRIISGKSKDEAEARAACTSGGLASESINSASESIKNKYQLDNVNIAWKALRESNIAFKNGVFNKELAEHIMALSGTVILKAGANDSEEGKVDYFIPKMNGDDVLKVLLEGGDLYIHECDEVSKCLNLTKDTKKYTVKQEDAFLVKIEKLIASVKDAIKSDNKKLPQGAEDFLNKTSLPVYRILNIHASYYAKETINIDALISYIALDLVYEYFLNINTGMRLVLSKHKNKFKNTDLGAFIEYQDNIRKKLLEERKKLQEKTDSFADLMERTARIEALLNEKLHNQIKVGLK